MLNGKVSFDMTSEPGEDTLDGLKVDRQGNVYVTGPGGLWIISPEWPGAMMTEKPSISPLRRGSIGYG